MRRYLLASSLLLASAVSSVHAAPPRGARAGGPVYVSSCAVMFGVRSSGSSSTRAGLFGNADAGKMRIDTEVQRIYRFTGADTATFQRITDALCGGASATLTAAGYQVLTDSAKTHFIWAEKDSAGQTSPQEQNLGQTRYLVFAPQGTPIGNPMVVGGGQGRKDSGVGRHHRQAVWASTGDDPLHGRFRLDRGAQAEPSRGAELGQRDRQAGRHRRSHNHGP